MPSTGIAGAKFLDLAGRKALMTGGAAQLSDGEGDACCCVDYWIQAKDCDNRDPKDHDDFEDIDIWFRLKITPDPDHPGEYFYTIFTIDDSERALPYYFCWNENDYYVDITNPIKPADPPPGTLADDLVPPYTTIEEENCHCRDRRDSCETINKRLNCSPLVAAVFWQFQCDDPASPCFGQVFSGLRELQLIDPAPGDDHPGCDCDDLTPSGGDCGTPVFEDIDEGTGTTNHFSLELDWACDSNGVDPDVNGVCAHLSIAWSDDTAAATCDDAHASGPNIPDDSPICGHPGRELSRSFASVASIFNTFFFDGPAGPTSTSGHGNWTVGIEGVPPDLKDPGCDETTLCP